MRRILGGLGGFDAFRMKIIAQCRELSRRFTPVAAFELRKKVIRE